MICSRAAAELLSVLVLSGLLAGCGEDRRAGPTARTTPRPLVAAGERTVAVSLSEYRLTPARPRVTRVGRITFDAINEGDVRHALAVEGPRGEVRTGTLAPGERATIALSLAPGSYKWYCPLGDHERLGMTGAVRVAQ